LEEERVSGREAFGREGTVGRREVVGVLEGLGREEILGEVTVEDEVFRVLQRWETDGGSGKGSGTFTRGL